MILSVFILDRMGFSRVEKVFLSVFILDRMDFSRVEKVFFFWCHIFFGAIYFFLCYEFYKCVYKCVTQKCNEFTNVCTQNAHVRCFFLVPYIFFFAVSLRMCEFTNV